MKGDVTCERRNIIVMICFLVIVAVLIGVSVVTPGKVADPDNYACAAYATVFALLPPVVAYCAGVNHKRSIFNHCLPELLSEHCRTATAIWKLMMNTMFFNESGGMVLNLLTVGISVF